MEKRTFHGARLVIHLKGVTIIEFWVSPYEPCYLLQTTRSLLNDGLKERNVYRILPEDLYIVLQVSCIPSLIERPPRRISVVQYFAIELSLDVLLECNRAANLPVRLGEPIPGGQTIYGIA
jgi:hypothetical protein